MARGALPCRMPMSSRLSVRSRAAAVRQGWRRSLTFRSTWYTETTTGQWRLPSRAAWWRRARRPARTSCMSRCRAAATLAWRRRSSVPCWTSSSGSGRSRRSNAAGLFQKFSQFRVKELWNFEVGDVPRIGNDHQFRARDGVGDVLCEFGEILAILLTADHECLDFDFRPVVNHRVEVEHLLVDRPDHGQA